MIQRTLHAALALALLGPIAACKDKDASAESAVVSALYVGSALAFFVWNGMVYYGIAIPMAAANVAGGVCGSMLASKLGSGFVRKVFLTVVSAFVAKLAWDQFR